MASATNLKWLAAVVIAHPIVPVTSEPHFPIMSGFCMVSPWLCHVKPVLISWHIIPGTRVNPVYLIVCFINDSASAPRNLGAKDQAKGARGSGAELLGHLELREKRAKTRPKSPKRQKGEDFKS